MYTVRQRGSLIPCILFVFLGLLASYFVPGFFPNSHIELPLFALFPGEIAVALIFSVLLFENAAPTDLIKLAAMMIFVSMADGAFCNIVGQGTTMLEDMTLQLNAVQLLVWNITGIGSIVLLYTSDSEDVAPPQAAREVPKAEAAKPEQSAPASKIDFTPADIVSAQAAAAQAAALAEAEKQQANQESAKDILEKLDVDRINKLEQQLSTTGSPDKVSLESLFEEETKAAGKAKKEDEPVAAAKVEEPAPEAVQTPPAPDAIPDSMKPADLSAFGGTPEPEPVKAEEPAKLLNDVSGDLDDIFADIAPGGSQKDFAPAEKSEPKAEEPAPEAPAGGLLSVSDNEMDDIFGGLMGGEDEKKPEEEKKSEAESKEPPKAPADEPAPAAPSGEPASQAGPKMTEAGTQAVTAVKEFGKLSAAASTTTPAAAGTLKTIGQMLLDSSAVERIIKQAEKQESGSKWRVLTVDRGANLQAMMDRMAKFPGVEGAILIGKDGMILSNTESLNAQKYVLGPLSLAIHSTTNLGTSKLHMGDLRQAVFKSGDNVAVIIDAGSGLLAVFGKYDVSRINQLYDHIMGTAAGEQVELPTVDEANLEEEPKPAEPAPEPAAAAAGGVMNVSDGEMDDIFGGLMSDESAEKAAPKAPASEPAAAGKPAEGGLLKVDDSQMDDIFGGLMSDESSDKAKPGMDFTPKQEAAPAEKPAEPAAEKPAEPVAEKQPEKTVETPKKQEKKGGKPTQIKEFGKLSAQALSKQQTGGDGGAMKAIGKQLIDVQAVENIIKSGEKREKIGAGLTTARVISAARGEGIKTLLSKIDSYEGVIGSLIVGHDGLVIASTLKGGIDKDMMGALSTAIHSHLDVAVKKIEKGKLQQAIFLSEPDDNSRSKLTVLTGVAVGILAVMVDEAELGKVDGLLQAIETTVRG